MAVEWHYSHDGEQCGPVSAGELKSMAERGELLPTDLVWREGMDDWKPAAKVKGLFSKPPATPKPSPKSSPKSSTVAKPLAPKSDTQPVAASEKDSPQEPPAVKEKDSQFIATCVFGSLLLAFIIGVFLFGPDELPEFKQRILAVIAAVLAGLFGYFFTGSIQVELKFIEAIVGDWGVKASGGGALFVIVLGWWLSPLAPVSTMKLDESPKFDHSMGKVLALHSNSHPIENISYSWDNSRWKPVQKFHASNPKFFQDDRAASGEIPSGDLRKNGKGGVIWFRYAYAGGNTSTPYRIDFDGSKADSFNKQQEEIQGITRNATNEAGKAMEEANETLNRATKSMKDVNIKIPKIPKIPSFR